MSTLTYGRTGTGYAIAKAAERLLGMREQRENTATAYTRMAAAMHRLIEHRTENPLAGLDVVTTARGVRERDWIDEALDRSIRRFEYPLDTPSKRRLRASALRHAKETT